MSRSHEERQFTMKVCYSLLPSLLKRNRRLNGVVELGVVIGKKGRDIPKSEAESYIAGYGPFPSPRRILS
jgi:2-keto-4-pentenoate hydratase/2-oxohepta-3-ene-1,7-dioic acid hydratase in catechol pathway